MTQDVEHACPGVEVGIVLKGLLPLGLALGAVVLSEAVVHDVSVAVELVADVANNERDRSSSDEEREES